MEEQPQLLPAGGGGGANSSSRGRERRRSRRKNNSSSSSNINNSNANHSNSNHSNSNHSSSNHGNADAQQPDWLVVNVGGVRFEASRQTLSTDGSSMLAAWVLRHSKSSSSGEELRIDRDGFRFAHVLNYLRNGTVWLEDAPSLRAVYEEACFFQLQGLQSLCEERIEAAIAKQEEARKARGDELRGFLKAELLRLLKDLRPCKPRNGEQQQHQLPQQQPQQQQQNLLSQQQQQQQQQAPEFRIDDDF